MSKQRKQSILTITLLLIVSSIHAQLVPTDSITEEDGLSSNWVYDIMQDQDGFIWFGTNRGLDRYDGYTIKTFNNDPFDSTSLFYNTTRKILKDSKNRLWVGSDFNGVSLYDRDKEIFYTVPVKLFPQENKDGEMWIVSEPKKDETSKLYHLKENISKDKGIFQFELEAKSYKINGQQKDERLRQLYRANDGTILLVTSKRRLMKWNDRQQQFEFIVQLDFDVKNLISETGDIIWVVSNIYSRGAIYKIQNGILTPIDLHLNQERYYLYDFKLNPQTNKLWIYSLHKSTLYGVDFSSLKNGYNLDNAEKIVLAPSVYPYSIYFDEGRTIWIGTNGHGVHKVVLERYPFRHLFVGKKSRRIFFTAEGNRVSAFDNDEISIKQNNASHLRNETDNEINIKNEKVWVLLSRSNTLVRLDKKGQEEKRYLLDDLNFHFGLSYRQYLNDKDGFLWFMGKEGLVKFDKATETFSLLKNENEIDFPGAVFWMYKDHKGIIWSGADEGLIKTTFKDENTVSHHYYQNDKTNRESLSYPRVSCILDDPTDPDTYLWVATIGGGFNKFNKKTEKFQHFTTKNGLPHNVVVGILAGDNGNLWLSTALGLTKFNPKEETYINFFKKDGLQGKGFSIGVLSKDEKTGELYFGGTNGITAFQPKDIQLSNYKPRVYITQLKIHGELVKVGKPLEQRGKNPLTQPIEFTKNIRLPWYQNQVTLDFVSLDFKNPEKNLYQYQLSSVDKDWIQDGNRRSVNYANLETGTYTFRVRATNSDGRWSSEEAVLKIVIYPPWYRTNLAYVIYAILLIFGVYKLYQDQVRRAKLRNELEFEQKEAARLAEMDKIKTNFFSNITHEFRTPLTLIIEPLSQALGYKNIPLPVKTKVELAERNSQRLLGLVNQLLDLSKLEGKKMKLELKRGDLLKFIAPIITSFEGFAQKKDIQFIYNAPNELPFFDFDKNKVEKVLFNLISNALKFTKVQGSVTVNVFEKNEQVHIQVIDTGIGIPENEQPHIFDRFYQVDGSNTRKYEGTGIGLALSKELTELMNGKLTFESTFGKGSTFEIFIPMVLSTETPLETKEQTAPTETLTTLTHLTTTETKVKPITINPDATNVALIIEDNEELRAFIKSSIEHKYQVIEAANGKEGLELALEHIPNIVISDVMMPIMDGFEVCKQLKTDEKTAHIPVILLTAKTAADSVIQGLKYGADAYMKKPFSTEELLLRMANLIEVRRQLQQKFSQTIEALPSNLTVSKDKSDQNPILAEENLSPFDKEFLTKVNAFIEKRFDDENLSVEDIAKAVFMSRTQLYRKLRALLNQSPSEFLRNYRLKVGKEFLQEQKGNVTEIAFMVGFSSAKYFSTKFKEKYGVSPREV